MVEAAFEEQLEALEQERAFVDLRGWGLTEVRGTDAQGWLNDLVTASVERLAEDEALRSFLLSPTGRIRADIRVLHARAGEGSSCCRRPPSPRRSPICLRPTSCRRMSSWRAPTPAGSS
jgi:hypothetical protein